MGLEGLGPISFSFYMSVRSLFWKEDGRTEPNDLFARYTASMHRNIASSLGGGKSFLDQAAATRYRELLPD